MDLDDSYSSDPRQRARVTSRDVDLEEAHREAEEQANAATVHHIDRQYNAAETSNSDISTSKRAVLLHNIRAKLLEYDEILIKTREIGEFQRPNDREYHKFRTWFWNNKPLSYEPEEELVLRKGDLVTLKPRAEWGKFDAWIEDRVSDMPDWLSKVCPTIGVFVETYIKLTVSSLIISSLVRINLEVTPAIPIYYTGRGLASRN